MKYSTRRKWTDCISDLKLDLDNVRAAIAGAPSWYFNEEAEDTTKGYGDNAMVRNGEGAGSGAVQAVPHGKKG